MFHAPSDALHFHQQKDQVLRLGLFVCNAAKSANVDNDIAVLYNYGTETGFYIKQKILGYDSVIRRSINTDKYSDIMRC